MAVLRSDDCGYAEQAARIAEYQIVHAPESEVPFISTRDYPGTFPDGCQVCGRSTWWEQRTLSDGRPQERCSECHDTITYS